MFIKIYKKSLYIGKVRIIKFTAHSLKKSLFKAFWILILLMMLVTLIFGGLSLLINDTTVITTPTDPNIIDLSN